MPALPSLVTEQFTMLYARFCKEREYSVLAQAIDQSGATSWIGGRRGETWAELNVMITLAAWTALSPAASPVLHIEIWAYADNTK